MYTKQDKLNIFDRREMLRVKLKSLAAEARFIRREEARTHGPLRAELRLHRIGLLRHDSRHTHLAYGFIRGRTLDQMEPNGTTPINWERVRKMLKKYGPANMADPEPIQKAA